MKLTNVVPASLLLFAMTTLSPSYNEKLKGFKSEPLNVKTSLTQANPNAALDTTQGWMDAIQQRLAQQEYNIAYDVEKKTYQSPNRNHNIRSFYLPGHLILQKRIDTKASNWQVKLTTMGVYADGKKFAEPQDITSGIAKEDTLTLQYASFREQYINNAEGVRQNFIVENAPENTHLLEVKIRAEGLKVVKVSTLQLEFSQNQKNGTEKILNYNDLKVWDADHKMLDARFETQGDEIAIIVNAEHARYPVTIDPLITNAIPNTILEGYAVVGVASAGDVNNDGYGDVIVRGNANYSLLYYGTANGISNISASTIDIKGQLRIAAGDINGDDYSDVMVSHPNYDDQSMLLSLNVYIFHGSASGIPAMPSDSIVIDQIGTDPDIISGQSLESAGDVNGDGFVDIIVGLPRYNNGQTYEGKILVYLGSATPISSIAAFTVESNIDYAQLGNSVASAGDVNGDGYGDVIVGSFGMSSTPLGGCAYVYYGSANGISTTPSPGLTSDQPNAEMGYSVSSAGDVNGDGYDDVIVGAPRKGAIYIFHGSPTGTITSPAVFYTASNCYYFGETVSYAGDVNGDGFDDVIARSGFDASSQTKIKIFVYFGSINGISTNSNPVISGLGNGSGISVAPAGDVNGDGYSDIIVGAQYYSGQFPGGAALIYHGSSIGLSGVTQLISHAKAASDLLLYKNIAPATSAGDVNGDGYSDIIVGTPLYDNGETDEGAAFVYHGSASGINPNVATVLEINQVNAHMGWSVSSACDVNGDGFGDVIVGAPGYDNGQTDEGAAFVYYGSATGIIPIPAAILEHNQENAQMGFSVSSVGDVNGDGYSDVIIGAPYKTIDDVGKVLVYHGSFSGINPIAANVLIGNAVIGRIGLTVISAGNVNGDGFSDVLIAANLKKNNQSIIPYVYVHHGSASGVTSVATTTLGFDHPDFGLDRGWSLSPAGDVNGDGYSDIIVGVPNYIDNNIKGRVFVFHGSAAGILTTAASSLSLGILSLPPDYGSTVASIGDENGDGYSDIAIGDTGLNDSKRGKVYIYQGSKNGIPIIASDTIFANAISIASAGDVNGDGLSDLIVGESVGQEPKSLVYYGSAGSTDNTSPSFIAGEQITAESGFSVASAGDVNGDGFNDVIVGAYLYDNGQTEEGKFSVYLGSTNGISVNAVTSFESNQVGANLGFSVASAGDVNGDGYGDVIVGARYYSNGENQEGAAFIYYGSTSGITGTPTKVESNLADAQMGWSVATAGDVNGDGYSDVIVGVVIYDNGQLNEGAAFVYHGSATGINTTPVAIIEGNQAGAFMGTSVASAGDVNGDGFSDVLIGAPGYDNGQQDEGRVYVFSGSVTGIALTAAAILESNWESAQFGTSVASAGDLNGDGFNDVIVGAPGYDNGQTNEGRAYVYHGSANGIGTTAANAVESNQIGAFWGTSVASAGDVNGDGYSDVIIGSPFYDRGQTDEGGAFVYHGSPLGIYGASAFLESNQASAQMGISVASAGDVNGDGFSDVIVGAYFYENGLTDEGATFVYYGNERSNIRNNLRLYNDDLTTIINRSNISDSDFGAGLFAKSFLGRNRGKLVWETQPQENGFDQASNGQISNVSTFTAQQNSYSNLGIAGVELKNLILKENSNNPIDATKIRVRVKYDPVLAITGQIYGPWRYMPGYSTGAGTHNNVPLPVTNTLDPKLLKVYPNPANETLMLEAEPGELEYVSLINSIGQDVTNLAQFSIVDTTKLQINISKLEQGVYFLKTTNSTIKIFKQ